MIDKEIIMKLAKQAGMNFTPAQFSGVLEDEIDEFELEEFTKLIEEYHSRKIDSELQQWKNVFGHLGTPDECGNAWIELIEQRDSLLNALVKIYNWESHSIELALDYGSIGARDFYRKIARTEIDKNDRPFGSFYVCSQQSKHDKS